MFENYKFVDLTHQLTPNIPSWNMSCGFKHSQILDYSDCTTEVKFRVQKMEAPTGIGTHMDAPAHCIEGGKTIDQIDLERLIVPCVMVDVSSKAHEKHSVLSDNIEEFESAHGKIPQDSLVIFYTGWSKHWDDPKKYHNNYVFPSISAEAAKLLVQRDIAGIGIDTLSPDRPSDGFPVHQVILDSGRYIVENVANADQLPPVGAYALVLPIKLGSGTEAPIRLVGLVPK